MRRPCQPAVGTPTFSAEDNSRKSILAEKGRLLYDNIPNVLSELIRTAFIPKPGHKFVVSDFSAIEARVLSHLTGERWRSEVFETGGDIYCASASKMFGVPVVKHGINGHLRQKGKIAELALGYGGAVGALRAMGALDMGLTEDELQPLVNSWRASNPHIVEYWWAVDDAVKTAIKHHIPTSVGDLQFYWKSNMLFIRLPSGRRLSYVQPRIGVNQFGTESVTYMGMDSQKKWSRIESYGPKFVENITQAISRDVLCNAMSNLKDLFICGHVHDELIIEVPKYTDLQKICNIMGQTPSWLPGFPASCSAPMGMNACFIRRIKKTTPAGVIPSEPLFKPQQFPEALYFQLYNFLPIDPNILLK